MLRPMTKHRRERKGPRPTLQHVGTRHRQGKRPRNAKPDAAFGRRRPTGANFPRVLFSGPAPLGRKTRRDTPTAAKKQPPRRASGSAEAGRGGCSAFTQLSQEPGKKLSLKANRRPLLAARAGPSKREKSANSKKRTRELHVTSQYFQTRANDGLPAVT